MKDLKRFLMGGILLSAVSLLIRTVSVFFNAYITKKIGEVGTGLYSLVMSVYSPALTLAISGVNLSSSRLVAEELGRGSHGSARDIMKKLITYSLAVSSAVAFLMTLLSSYISKHLIGDLSARYLLCMLAAGLPFVALSSALSGYFTARRKNGRNAVIQVTEQVFRVGFTVFVLQKMMISGVSALAGVILCSVSADIISCLLWSAIGKADISGLSREGDIKKDNLKNILGITVPVSLSSFLRSGLVAIEHILIPKGLKKSGASYESAMASYGVMSGMAMPIIMFPSSILYSFSGLLIPEFAEANRNGLRDSVTRTAEGVIRTVLIFSVGAAGVLIGFCHDIGMAVYQSTEAVKYIALLAPIIPVMYLDTAVDSILKGLGEQVYTMKVNIADALISVISVFFLVPRLGLYGYILVIFLSEMFNFSFSLHKLRTVASVRVSIIKAAALPLTAAVSSVLLTKAVMRYCYFLSTHGSSAVFGIGLTLILYLCGTAAAMLYGKKRGREKC